MLDLRFRGANPNAEIVPAERLKGKVNYLRGDDRAMWKTNLPTYSELRYQNLWPGVDMVFRGAGGRLKYEFLVRPGAKVSDIGLAYAGAQSLSLSSSEGLLIHTSRGTMSDTRPRSFQRIAGYEVPVESRFSLSRGTKAYGFKLGRYDRSHSLVIDPGLEYSTYLGGTSASASDIAVDDNGNAYVVGNRFGCCSTFPTTPGAFDPTPNGSDEAWVAKLDPTGSELLYATFLGAPSRAEGIAVDGAGNAYATGWGFVSPTPGAYATPPPGVWVVKLNATGSALLYSSNFGSPADFETPDSIAIDDAGNAYVTGETNSNDFPTTPGAFDRSNAVCHDAFVTKLNATGSAPVYSTYLGAEFTPGCFQDQGKDIAVDSAGNGYVIGFTDSPGFPTTPGAHDTTLGGSSDAFVTKLNPLGSALVYSTFLGGPGLENGLGIAVDAQGSAYATGSAFSSSDGPSGFPATPGAHDASCNQPSYVAKLTPNGSDLLYATCLEGTSSSLYGAVAIDARGRAHTTGQARPNMPTTDDAFDRTSNGVDAFVAVFDATGSHLDYSTFLGGSNTDIGEGIAVLRGAAFVTGFTDGPDFPTTPGAWRTNGGGRDAFVTKLAITSVPATLTLGPTTATNTVDSQHCVTATSSDATGSPTPDITVRFSVTGSVTTGGQATTDQNGEAQFCYDGPSLPGADAITAFADTDGDGIQDAGEPGDAATKEWVLPPGCAAHVRNNGEFTAQNGDRAKFHGEARSSGSGRTKGREDYRDRGPVDRLRIRSIAIETIACDDSPGQASVFGQAAVNGSGPRAFRIDVRDLGEPGKDTDTYRIRLDTGYDSGEQTLRKGNVQVRRR